VLTKGDLLSPALLAASLLAVSEDLAYLIPPADRASYMKSDKRKAGAGGLDVMCVSAATGAGIQALWEEIRTCAEETSKPIVPASRIGGSDEDREELEVVDVSEGARRAKAATNVVREHASADVLRRQVAVRQWHAKR